MAQYIRPERASHWYWPDGRPAHAMPKKSAPGELRATTAADASTLGLLPSVTNILDVVYRYVLEAWKDNRLVIAALHNPRADGESDEDYAARIIDYAEAPASEAADLGTRIHRGIELLLNTKATGADWYLDDPEVVPFVDGFAEWWRQQRIEAVAMEQAFACPEEGYGGTADLVAWQGKHFVVDWTTTSNPELPIYPEKFCQVAAYRRGLGITEGGMAVVVISSVEPGRIQPYELDESQVERYWRGFAGARDVFYSPMGKGRNLPWSRDGASRSA